MIVLLWLLWVPIAAVMNGFLISTFWSWFITGNGAAFHEQAMHGALPMDISVIQALGISTFISYFLSASLISVLNRLSDNGDSEGESFAKAVIAGVAFWALSLVVGAIYHSFM